MNVVSDFYRHRAVAVTGASGYIGAALTAALLRHGARVLEVGRRSLDEHGWPPIVADAGVIFHLGGNTSVLDADRDPQANYRSTVTAVDDLIAAAAHAHRQPRVVFASTVTVYGLTTRLPVDEQVAPNPITTYDSHKWEAERRLAAAAGQRQIESVALRLANVYGPSPAPSADPARGFLNRSVRDALGGKALSVYGDGSYVRDFVYMDDVIEAFLAAGLPSAAAQRCYNVGSGAGVTIGEALSQIAAQASLAIRHSVAIDQVPWPPGAHPIERRSFVADTTRIEADLGWRATVPLADGIARCCAHRAFAVRDAS
jgi:nucleoside-diphosphate-sugar epimerase